MRTYFLLLAASLLATPILAEEPAAVRVEERVYDVLISGKRSGGNTLTIREFAEGKLVVEAEADVRLNFVVYEYVYKFSGQETWEAGRLQAFEGRAEDGGTKTQVRGTNEPRGSQIQIDDAKPQAGPAHVLSTNFWQAPPAELLGRPQPVLDPDTGKTLKLTFRKLETGLLQSCDSRLIG